MSTCWMFNEADIGIGGFACRGLLDTGAMVTSVSENFYRWQYLEKDHPIQKLDKILSGRGRYGGYKLPYQGFIEAIISVPDVEECKQRCIRLQKK